MPPTQHSPSGPPPLSKALKDAIQAANTRAEEGQRIFGPIATLWDEYQQSDTVRKLPPQLRKPLLALCQEISRTATIHFDAYIKGSRPTQALPTPQPSPPPSGVATPAVPESPPALSPTYAQKAATPPPRPQKTTNPKPPAKAHPPTRPDTRLFVWVDPDHISRKAGPFAVLTALKNLLGQDSSLLREVQAVKSGFALCTGSLEALTKLEAHSEAISRSFEGATVERQPQWTSYRLLNVPRTVNTINGLGEIISNQVTGPILAESILEVTNQALTRAVETKDSTQKNLYNTCWIVSFLTEAHCPLPRNLRILGASITAAVIKVKPKTVQCTRCYHWHNARSCTRPQSCRLCGSKQHQEENHTTRCATSGQHSCPARCLHCGGPHTADDTSCPLRPTPHGPRTESEKKAILETSKLARIRACLAANCSRKPQTDPQTPSTAVNEQNMQMETLPTAPRTPNRKPLRIVATTPSGPRFSSVDVNSSIPLSFNA